MSTREGGRLSEIPPYGLGTWKCSNDTIREVIRDAIRCGIRHIDCSPIYMNERQVGLALKEIFEEGLVAREELWITSKLWCTMHRPDNVGVALTNTLNDLGLEYLDLYLIHWPLAVKSEGHTVHPVVGVGIDENGTMVFENTTQMDTYRAMEQEVRNGRVRHIGISNFDIPLMLEVHTNATIKPYCNQIECHPYLNQENIIAFANALGMRITAYSPLCTMMDKLFSEPILNHIAKKHNTSVVSVLIRFHIDRGLSVVTKSSSPNRVKDNYINSHNFKLDQNDIQQLLTLGSNSIRTCNLTIAKNVTFF